MTNDLPNIFALWLSRVFHPFVTALVTIVGALCLVGTPIREVVYWTLAALVIIVIPPAVFIWHGVGIKRLSDHQVSIREQRHMLYVVGITSLGLFFAVTLYFDAPPILTATILAATVANVVASIINRILTKISLHAGATAGCAAALFWVSPQWGTVFATVTIATGWARIRTKHHTVTQVLAGWGVAIGAVTVIFPLFV